MSLKSPVVPSASPSSPLAPSITQAQVDELRTGEVGTKEPEPETKDPSQRHSSSDTSSLAPPPSPYPQSIDPSPVESHGSASTQTTDIDDSTEPVDKLDTMALVSSMPRQSSLTHVDTALAATTKADGETLSVIHAPEGFVSSFSGTPDAKIGATVTVSPATTEHSGNTIISTKSPEPTSATSAKSDKPLLNTSIPSVKDRPTPCAKTRQEVEEEWKQRSRRSKPLQGTTQRATDTPGLWSTWLADIPETQNQDEDEETLAGSTDQRTTPQVSKEEQAQIDSLKSALSECWTLTNTLASLSSTHRTRVFNHRGQAGMQEMAWQKCWKLCQELYNTRHADPTDHVLSTLTMCREFCTALFDARRKDDELADSVLRVSFELNQHLFNTQDPNIPSAFQERTLDFYLTICHRLMKQRTSLPEETDALLRACWSLAETLFSIRQNNRDGKPADEDLLAVAVQACWDLCDLFREGWSQVRPDRGTPRAHNPGYFQSSFGRSQTSFSAHSSPSMTRNGSGSRSYADSKAFPPETPTTIFDDTNDDDDDHGLGIEPQAPNILVLGNPDNNSNASHHRQPNNPKGWTSAASTYSGYSESTTRSTRSTSAKATAAMQANMACIRILVVRAAMVAGYTGSSNSNSSPPSQSGGSSSSPRLLSPATPAANKAFSAFIKDLSATTAFGTMQWQIALVQHLKELVLKWPGLVQHVGAGGDLGDGNLLPGPHDSSSAKARRSASATDIARAVEWMMRSEQYAWMGGLYRTVFGTTVEDALANDGVSGVIVQA